MRMEHELNTEELKIVLLDMVAWFDAFARKNGIRYSMHGGTLLGAMRHQGFIPWDDDMDLAMLREDYERLMELMQNEHGRYQLLAPEINPKYLYPFAKLVDTQTVLVEETLECGVPLGIGIDIFPLDRDTDDMALRAKNKKRLDSCASMISFVMSKTAHTSKGLRLMAAKAMDVFFAVVGKRFATNRMLRELKRIYSHAEYDTYVSTFTPNYALKQHLKREWMEHLVPMKFEHLELPGYEKSDEFLTELYGDWRKLPPVEQQVAHHDFQAWLKG